MNKAKLKSYAPAARRDFIQAVTDRAHFFGLSEKQLLPVDESGDVAIIGGRPFPRAVAAQRRKLDARVKRDGFSQVMEAVAYTWFNRFLALRYMELHGYLEHGFRVLSNTGSSTVPEILDHATQLELPGLNKQEVVELKLDGSKDAELYRLLLVAQCNALHKAMPFLFEKIGDETELLLPDNLLHSDSLIRRLVTEIDEEDWQEVEIIGWLYQFYISEKKDQVIGKVVKSEDIPAATQLFTPKWIVKYMVQNSLGRQWVATYPDSPLKAKMEYYIEPAEQTDEVNSQLAAITPDLLDPEKLTLLDPACGSGHILVEAYDIFKEIYLERGYSGRDFPRLILEKNLFGLDIDDRAAQMAGFALLMKARKDDRRILRSDNPIKLNVMAIQESGNISVENGYWGEHANALRELVDLFRHGKTFGSLIQVSEKTSESLLAIKNALRQITVSGDLYASQNARALMPLVEQAGVLAGKYDCVVTNPPYMGNKGMNQTIKDYAVLHYPDSKFDLFSMFIQRDFFFCRINGHSAMVTMQSWMFLSSYERLRRHVISNRAITTLIHIGYNSFPEINSKIAQACAFTIHNCNVLKYIGRYIDLNNGIPQSADKEVIFCNKTYKEYDVNQLNYEKIPNTPIAYWVGEKEISLFENNSLIIQLASPRKGMDTGNNSIFLRLWFEVCATSLSSYGGSKWFPYNKGGDFRRWYGNREYILNWENDGLHIKSRLQLSSEKPTIRNESYYFKEGYTWTTVSSGGFSARYSPIGSIFDNGGCTLFSDTRLHFYGGLINSKVAGRYIAFLAPTLNFQPGDIGRIPVRNTANDNEVQDNTLELVNLSKEDWDFVESSWEFQSSPCLSTFIKSVTLSDSWQNWQIHCNKQIWRMQELETENNRLFIEAYGLQDELTPEVPEDQITHARADREADMKRLISYAIGCMMGRYSLDKIGLVYANSGNFGFDSTKYKTFPADDDGIIPVMDMDWFSDDASSRFEEFLKVAWSPETLDENMKFVADSLSSKNGETPRETIRRYISTHFFKDHLQTYKKRPIYWLFSSGKQRAFECLVYLHRYNEATLSRMRNEYVTPLQGKFSAQVDYLVNEVNAATSTAERNRLQKQLDTLRKKKAELAAFDDLLRHYADQRISLDLDDGVKVNYGKFGNILAETKIISSIIES